MALVICSRFSEFLRRKGKYIRFHAFWPPPTACGPAAARRAPREVRAQATDGETRRSRRRQRSCRWLGGLGAAAGAVGLESGAGCVTEPGTQLTAAWASFQGASSRVLPARKSIRAQCPRRGESAPREVSPASKQAPG